jgi:hypothetical protein
MWKSSTREERLLKGCGGKMPTLAVRLLIAVLVSGILILSNAYYQESLRRGTYQNAYEENLLLTATRANLLYASIAKQGELRDEISRQERILVKQDELLVKREEIIKLQRQLIVIQDSRIQIMEARNAQKCPRSFASSGGLLNGYGSGLRQESLHLLLQRSGQQGL